MARADWFEIATAMLADLDEAPPEDFLKHILRLVYRLLFLMVTEETWLS